MTINKELTLVIIKPDAIQRRLVGEIISRIEKTSLEIIEMKMITADEETLIRHYNKNESWMKKIGERSIEELRNRNLDPEKIFGSSNPLDIGKKAYKLLLEYMQRGPVIVMVVSGYNAISVMRKLSGATSPKEALPGTIRGDYAFHSGDTANALGIALENLIHCSENIEEANREIAVWQKYLNIKV